MTATPDQGVSEGQMAPDVPTKHDAQEEPRDPDAPAPEFEKHRTGPATGESTTTRNERFELYKLAVEMADRVSERRTAANNFFLALHAAFASIVTFLGVYRPR